MSTPSLLGARIVSLVALLLLAGPSTEAGESAASAAATEILFTNVSTLAGVSGDLCASPTWHSLGVNWIDFDEDGWPDLFAVGGAAENLPHLFRNRGDGTFERADALLPSLPAVEMSGSVFADYDRDGDQDIFVYTDNPDFVFESQTNPPDGPPDLLLRNLFRENGSRLPSQGPLFEEVAAQAGVQGLAEPPFGELPGSRGKTAAWLDYDRDGCIDLFVGNLVVGSGGAVANRDRLYRNRCDGTFVDVTVASGVNPGNDPTRNRPALAVGGFHLDDDPWPDLYVVNISEVEPFYHLDLFFRNQGPDPDGLVTFAEITTAAPGVGDDSQAGMGIDVADVDLDGDWDIYISDIDDTTLDAEPRGNVLYLGDGSGHFADNSAVEAGVESTRSWGVNFFDADLDGWEDLFVATPAKSMFRNDGADLESRAAVSPVTFTKVSFGAALALGNSRGSATADYDRDGDLDLAVVNQAGSLQLFRNDTTTSGHWLAVELFGSASNTDAIGAVVLAETGGVVRRRQVKGGSSAHSQDALSVHFGLGGNDVVDRLTVHWPSGAITVLESLAADRHVELVEPLLFADGFESGGLARWLLP